MHADKRIEVILTSERDDFVVNAWNIFAYLLEERDDAKDVLIGTYQDKIKKYIDYFDRLTQENPEIDAWELTKGFFERIDIKLQGIAIQLEDYQKCQGLDLLDIQERRLIHETRMV
jgi:hypothetical protein